MLPSSTNMRPKTYEALHILLGLSPQASAAEMILAASRETEKTQNALDTLLRLRTEQEQQHQPEESVYDDDHETSTYPGSLFDTPEEHASVNEVDSTSEHVTIMQYNDSCANYQTENPPESDSNSLQTIIRSRGPWTSFRGTLMSHAFTLFDKAKTIAGPKTFKPQGSKAVFTPQSYSITNTTTSAFMSSHAHPGENFVSRARHGPDIPREGTSQEISPVICGLQIAGTTVHLNCPPPCRNTTTLTQFPALPEQTYAASEDNDDDPIEALPLDDEENVFDPDVLQDIINRSRGQRQRKTVFGLFPN